VSILVHVVVRKHVILIPLLLLPPQNLTERNSTIIHFLELIFIQGQGAGQVLPFDGDVAEKLHITTANL
jgi:hypothetical protein